MSLVDLLRAPPEDAIVRFLEAWHGPPTGEPREPARNALPEIVGRLMAFADVWPRAIVQNHLGDPGPASSDGKRVFYLENQSVYAWATDGVSEDPVVWGRFSHEERWLAEREPLSRFLLQVVVFEAIMGAAHAASASWVTLPQLEAALGPLERLPFGSWRWPAEPTWFYAGADMLAFTSPNGPAPDGPLDHFDVFLGAHTKGALDYLREVDGIGWDREPE